uniref:Uncharacterized protein n=1 Tax=Panagrolaimus sp. PS1159 TaxID=55785 RepID=A0AC35EUA7_9BILA
LNWLNICGPKEGRWDKRDLGRKRCKR